MAHEIQGMTGAKVASAFTLFGVAIIPLLVTFFLPKAKLKNSEGRVLPFFAGGAMLSLALIHLIPESMETLSRFEAVINGSGFNFSFALVTFGILVMSIIDSAVHFFASKSCLQFHQHQAEAFDFSSTTKTPYVRAYSNPDIELKQVENAKTAETGTEADMCNSEIIPVERVNSIKSESMKNDRVYYSTVVVAVLLFFHSFFDGLAVGTQTSVLYVWIVTGIICSHKVVVSSTLGISMILSGMGWKQVFAFGFLFSIASPIGLLVYAVAPKTDLLEGVVSSIAAGVLLYVGFEMPFNEKLVDTSPLVRVLQALALLLGCILIFLATLLEHVVGVED